MALIVAGVVSSLEQQQMYWGKLLEITMPQMESGERRGRLAVLISVSSVNHMKFISLHLMMFFSECIS